jgi:hypothetical protein
MGICTVREIAWASVARAAKGTPLTLEAPVTFGGQKLAAPLVRFLPGGALDLDPGLARARSVSNLSDAELARRGVPRDALNRCIFEIVTTHT